MIENQFQPSNDDPLNTTPLNLRNSISSHLDITNHDNPSVDSFSLLTS